MPIFTYKGVECVSAGIIFYRISENGAIELLMQQKKDRKTGTTFYEDLGGKSSCEDMSIEDVAAREAAEESNGQIVERYMETDYVTKISRSKNYILDLIRKNSISLMQRRNKYALFLVFLPGDHRNYNFGLKELHPRWDIWRTIDWVQPKDAFQNLRAVHPRIRHLLKFF